MIRDTELECTLEVIVGKDGCKRSDIVKKEYERQKMLYVYIDIENISKETKKLIEDSKKFLGLKYIKLPYIISGDEILFIDDEFDSIEEFESLLNNKDNYL